MKKIYLDCDGVILDTINRSYQMLKDQCLTTEEEINQFYSSIDWGKLIEESGPIDNAINKIKELSKYFEIEILTHVNTTYEAGVKIEYFKRELPGIKVVPVPKTVKKADFVNAYGTILVDDFLSNLDYWKEQGGIPIKFSDSGKECPYTVITDLLELIELYNKNKLKVKE